MNKKQLEIISQNSGVSIKNIESTIELLDQGATIPFISRYRKEKTGGLDEVEIAKIKEEYTRLKEIENRKESIISSIEKQEKMTPVLKTKILNCYDANELEDIYLPYKQKRLTRAVKAKEKGLEPLANLIFSQTNLDLETLCLKFLNDSVETMEDALQGARDIIAEQVSEDIKARETVRNMFRRESLVFSKVVKSKKDEAEKYQDYFDYSQELSKIPSHRLLAIRRGEEEGFLKAGIKLPDDKVILSLNRLFVKSNSAVGKQVEMAVEDAYSRLLEPSIETEFKGISKEKADKEAINVFTNNLRQLLLASPLGEKRILSLDPGFSSGCKLVCLDEHGNLLHNENIYPHPPQSKTFDAAKKVASLVNAYKIDAIAIGNGTAGRETEHFIRNKVKFDRDLSVFVVSENGASIYSASPVAREEFPDYDVTVRGAVSIGRRLADPLAELVKLDPKSIGVGQYQHDVNQKMLQESLDMVVESCVNSVGINLNTASKHLLNYVSGLGPQLAQNIVEYRSENGAFKSRSELKKVKRMGEKAFEQAAGFLRIRDAKNPLDNSAVHPEAYHIPTKMAKDLGVTVKDLIEQKELRSKIDLNKYIDANHGLPTLQDIMKELEKPGRDPRKQIKVFEFSQEVYKISDLKEGMVLPGIVTNITNFGAFVDIGVKQDGLVHISQIKEEFISNPADVLSLHQHVKVKVTSVEVDRKRIQLTMIGV